MSDTYDHQHNLLHRHTFHDGRHEYDSPCLNPGCGGVLRVTMFYAPDVGAHWKKCCCCEREMVGSHVVTSGTVRRHS